MGVAGQSRKRVTAEGPGPYLVRRVRIIGHIHHVRRAGLVTRFQGRQLLLHAHNVRHGGCFRVPPGDRSTVTDAINSPGSPLSSFFSLTNANGEVQRLLAQPFAAILDAAKARAIFYISSHCLLRGGSWKLPSETW